MNPAENYTYRYLETDDLDQYNALLRYTFQVTEDELTATGWKDDEIKQSKFPVLERADVLGCFDGENLVSQFAVYPLKMNIYDAVYHVGFVTSVCTYPEYTGNGIMKRLMIQGLTQMHKEGKSFALLYPYSIPLYHHLGWEIISNKISYNIKDRQIPTKVSAPGYVRRVAWDNTEFHELHSHFASITHGCLFRNALAWEEYWRWDEDDTNVAVYYNVKDKPCGYMVYLIKNDIMHIKEMIYLNREAQKGLWEYIHAHDSMIDEVHGNTYFSEPIAFEIDDGDIKETIRPYAMGRIVDVASFLEDYPCDPDGGELCIDLERPHLPHPVCGRRLHPDRCPRRIPPEDGHRHPFHPAAGLQDRRTSVRAGAHRGPGGCRGAAGRCAVPQDPLYFGLYLMRFPEGGAFSPLFFFCSCAPGTGMLK